MAYAAIASLSQTIDLILDYHHHSISPLFKNKITSLHEHIIFLRSFFEDSADETDSWEERICQLTNIAEDIIELLLLESFLQTSKPKGKYEILHDLDELERVSSVIESIVRGVKERHREAVDSSNDDMIEIISQLGEKGYGQREVIVIGGSGGIGKSTLARNVYNHPTVVEQFEIRGWVTVSKDYSWRGILSSLLSSMNNRSNVADDILKSKDELSSSLANIVRGKRYLIVLDDVWTWGVWQTFKDIIPEDFYKNRVIITSRSPIEVADSRRRIHWMRLMNRDQSWNLLRQKIFNGNQCPPKLEHIGKMIVKWCGGLPLAITVVSGILAADQTEVAWEDISENLKNSITFGDNNDDEKQLFQILSLSYTNLPHYLRPYLLYLGMFPEDGEIRVSKLIKLWLAEGFLCGSLEEMVYVYLEVLVRRSLVFVRKRKSNGRIKSLSIHDLVREMCMRQALVESFFHAKGLFPTAIKHQRRVSICASDLEAVKNVHGSTIRTMICLEGDQRGFQGLLGYFRLLRILDLSHVYNYLEECDFPNQVFELFNLRYLAFSYAFRISEAISNLENLQTLIIHPRKSQRRIIKLPVEIWRMRQLSHLIVLSCELPCQEEAMIPLENLQMLSKAADLICCTETLKMIPNLKKLCITFTSWRDRGTDYELDNLTYLQKLESLKLKAQDRLKKLPKIRPPALHPTLKKLSLRGLGLAWEDMKIVALLPNLQMLKLRNNACIGETWETSEGGFSQLTFLLIDESNLKNWVTETSHFPRLESLVLHRCWCMREVPRDIGDIRTLELIQVDQRNKTLLQSAKQIQQDRQSLGNDSLEIRLG